MESFGYFADSSSGLSQLHAYQRNLLNLPDPPIDSALAELFAEGPHVHLTTDELAAELAADAPPHILPPIVDFGMFQAAQQKPLELRAESSSIPEPLHAVSAARAVAQPSESELCRTLATFFVPFYPFYPLRLQFFNVQSLHLNEYAGIQPGARAKRSSPSSLPSHLLGSSLGSQAASSHSDSDQDLQEHAVPGDPDFVPAAKEAAAAGPKDTKTKLREKNKRAQKRFRSVQFHRWMHAPQRNALHCNALQCNALCAAACTVACRTTRLHPKFGVLWRLRNTLHHLSNSSVCPNNCKSVCLSVCLSVSLSDSQNVPNAEACSGLQYVLTQSRLQSAGQQHSTDASGHVKRTKPSSQSVCWLTWQLKCSSSGWRRKSCRAETICWSLCFGCSRSHRMPQMLQRCACVCILFVQHTAELQALPPIGIMVDRPDLIIR